MKETIVIPDSSFFICFIDDISKPHYLETILNKTEFSFVVGKIIITEIKDAPENAILREHYNKNNIAVFDYYDYGEILRPFFSIDEINKGEHEVIIITYILNLQGKQVITILDDNSPKKFLKNLLLEKSEMVTGTVGFVEKCTCEYNIFFKEKGINILTLIKQSKFWIENEIVDNAIIRIKGCKRV